MEGGMEGVIYAFLSLIFVEYLEEGEEVEGLAKSFQSKEGLFTALKGAK